MKKYFAFLLIFATFTFAATLFKSGTMKDLKNKKHEISEYLEKGPVLINFWNLACEPCKKEMKFLDKFHKKYAEQGFQVLSINTDNPRSINRVKAYLRTEDFSFDILSDPRMKTFRQNGGKVFPFVLLLNQDGTVEKQHIGYNPGDEVALEKEIKELIENNKELIEKNKKAAE